ncbi:MAG: STAS/SEC14 domain-containing protein [Lacibacter sp.]
MQVTIPTDRPIYESEIATYWFDDAGFLVSLSKSVKRTVENISSNSEMIKKISNNKPVPLLIYLAPSPMPDKDAREISTKLLPLNYSAMAMVSKPGLAALIMSLLFKLKPSPVPIKQFTHEKEAREWLMQYAKADN